MLRILVATLALATAAPALADAASEAAGSYTLETAGTTEQVRPGAPGKLVLFIHPKAGTHVHPQAPLAIALEAPAGVKLAKEKLGHKDAVDPKAEAPRFEVPFTAAAAGRYELKAAIDFFICSDTWCVKQSRALSVPVVAKQ
ncbi:hypothetical protein [Anaeromyxobacter paludicola]|uniref:Thiol:disulfide interchange protein DsbD N-terminal domain-containing protein n=1 Tax=Anaeromyxobacter paludicola TaxID=2918171 RepID=A0ABN6N6L2_9BACT|nr:hypothetical protein [Anaeromyxobacter paludicola]BDG07773.1 hypothetical protein AMPC_08860 [Anaeromyxobacter paludicola]